MYDRIRAKVKNDQPETTKAKTLELFDEYRRLDEELYKRRHISPQQARHLMDIGQADEYRAKTNELSELRDEFVHTNSWHYMKNECWLLGLW